MKKIALFNHKGGVGKTTLTVNIAAALGDMGVNVLLVDADPQCNLTSFFLNETTLEELLSWSGEQEGGETIWAAVKPVAEGRGDIADIPVWEAYGDNVSLLAGDVLLSEYEEVLPEAWANCFVRRTRGYDVMSALANTVDRAGASVGADICFYDMGPNVGALNRAILLDCDYFITPVAADLFSLRALSTVGRSVAKWIKDWETVCTLATDADRQGLLPGKPAYLGYIASAFKVSSGSNAADPHADWEKKIAPRVRDRIVKDLEAVDKKLVPYQGQNKVGGVKHFHSLAPAAQKHGVPLANLRGFVNRGHGAQIKEAKIEFDALAKEIAKRARIKV